MYFLTWEKNFGKISKHLLMEKKIHDSEKKKTIFGEI